MSSVSEIARLRQRWFISPLPFVTDGVVMHLDSQPQGRFWQPGRGNWRAAWKYPPPQRVFEVKGIHFTTGRTGKVTVILALEPGVLGDKRVGKVNIGSAARWQKLDVAPYDLVSISLAGQGIPRFDNVVWRSKQRAKPALPGSRSRTDCLFYQPGCRQQFLAHLSWMSRPEILDMPGISRAHWQLLNLRWQFRHLFSWLSLTLDDLRHTNGLSGLKAREVWQRFQLVRRQTFKRWLQALAVPVPHEALNALTDSTWNQLKARDEENWRTLPGVGASRARKLREFIHSPQVSSIVAELKNFQIPGFFP